jgi:hypothetical protein
MHRRDAGVRSINSITSITKMELEENIRCKELTPAELSRQMVRKAVQVAPAISSVAEEKKPQGRKRTYAAPKAEVAQAIGVSTMTLVNAEQHVAVAGKYLELAATWSTEVVAHGAARVSGSNPTKTYGKTHYQGEAFPIMRLFGKVCARSNQHVKNLYRLAPVSHTSFLRKSLITSL